MLKTELDPWRVIRGVVFDMDNAREIPGVVDRAGLQVDWTLTGAQDWSHATRKAAYRPRIDTAYDALPREEDRLRVTFIVAKELAERGFTDRMNDALGAIGWTLKEGRLIPSDDDVRELFFPPKSQHDAYVEIRGILQRAATTIIVVDPYIDSSILRLVGSFVKSGMNLRLLTSRLPGDFSTETEKWRSQHGGTALEVRVTREFHDRFILLDEAHCWHVGCSIKDAGNKAFMLSQVEDAENIAAIKSQIDLTWQNATDPEAAVPDPGSPAPRGGF
jgi:hypothetical protein